MVNESLSKEINKNSEHSKTNENSTQHERRLSKDNNCKGMLKDKLKCGRKSVSVDKQGSSYSGPQEIKKWISNSRNISFFTSKGSVASKTL